MSDTPPKLTKKQAAFRDAILAGFKPSESYKKAFNAQGMSKKAIANEAQKLLRHPKVSLAITLATRTGKQPTVLPALSVKIRMSMDDRLEELRCAARLDPAEAFDELNHFKSIREMPEHVRRCIAGFEVDPLSFVTKVKFVSKLAAIDLYSKLAGDIPRGDTPPPPPPSTLYDRSKLTDAEWEEYKRIRRKAVVELIPNGHAG